MCDGVTQGLEGMELSLFSRDHIAQSTIIALSHQMFDGVVCLGICDKIVPGLLMGALRFGDMPMLFVRLGPCNLASRTAKKPEFVSCSPKAKSPETSCWMPNLLLPFGGYLYVLRHRQQQSDFDGGQGLQLPVVIRESRYPLRDALTAEAAQHITRVTALGSKPGARQDAG